MAFVYKIGAVFFLLMLTLWLQCGGIAALISWMRRAVPGDIQKLGPLRSAVLVVRVTTALIALHGLEVLIVGVLLLLALLPIMGIRLVFLGKQLCDRWLW